MTDVMVDLVAIGAAMLVVALIGAKGKRRPLVVRAVALVSIISSITLLSTLISTAPAVKRWKACSNFEIAASADQPALLLAQGEPATDTQRANFYCSMLDSNQFTVVAKVTSDDLDQAGPTRIVTSSTGTNIGDFNFHIGQQQDKASLRFRAGSSRIINLYDNVFLDNDVVTLTLTYDRGQIRYWADGRLLDEIDVGDDALSTWDLDYPLLTGDEHNGGRRFVGTIKQVELTPRVLDASGN